MPKASVAWERIKIFSSPHMKVNQFGEIGGDVSYCYWVLAHDWSSLLVKSRAAGPSAVAGSRMLRPEQFIWLHRASQRFWGCRNPFIFNQRSRSAPNQAAVLFPNTITENQNVINIKRRESWERERHGGGEGGGRLERPNQPSERASGLLPFRGRRTRTPCGGWWRTRWRAALAASWEARCRRNT